MTGGELIEWIHEHHAEDLDIWVRTDTLWMWLEEDALEIRDGKMWIRSEVCSE